MRSSFCAAVFVAVLQVQAHAGNAKVDACLASDAYKAFEATTMACEKLDLSNVDTKTRAKVAYQRGAAIYWQYYSPGAFPYLDEALSLDENLHAARLRRAWLHLMTGNRLAAYSDFVKLNELAADDPHFRARAVLGFGQVHGMLGESDKQLESLKQAVAIDPSYYYGRVELTYMQYHIDKHTDRKRAAEQALAETEKLLSLGPDELNKTEFRAEPSFATRSYHTYVRYKKAEYLLEADRFEETLALATDVARLEPGQPLSNNLIVRALISLDRYEEALHAADQPMPYCDGRPLDNECRLTKSYKLQALHNIKAYGKVRTIAEQMIAESNQDGEAGTAHFFLGLALNKLGDSQEAMREIIMGSYYDPFWRRKMLLNLIRRGYYTGLAKDELSDAAVNGLEACLLDEECMAKI